MNLTFQERYQAGETPLHRLDARIKMVMTLALIIGIVSTPEHAWPAYPLLWALVASLAMTGGVSVRRLAKLGGVALPFALAAVTLLFTLPGEPVLTVFGARISDAGLMRFISIVLKSWLSVQSALLLSMTTHFSDLLWAMGSLRVPGVLVAIIGFMYRYLFTLKDEAERLLRGRASRSAMAEGHKPGGKLLWRAQVAGGMVGNLFLRSYERSERVYAAMLARGYTGQFYRSDAPPLTGQALLWGIVPVVFLILIQILAFFLWS